MCSIIPEVSFVNSIRVVFIKKCNSNLYDRCNSYVVNKYTIKHCQYEDRLLSSVTNSFLCPS